MIYEIGVLRGNVYRYGSMCACACMHSTLVAKESLRFSARAKTLECLLSPNSANSPFTRHFIPRLSFLPSHPLPSTSPRPLSLLSLWPPPQQSICGRGPSTEAAKACPCPTTSPYKNGSYNSSSSNNNHTLLLSHLHPVGSLDKSHTGHIIIIIFIIFIIIFIFLTPSTSHHVRCRENQIRRWRQTPETSQCMDHLSFRQTTITAPSPRRPAQTDPGGGVQDNFGTMARRVGRCTRPVRAARRDGQGGARAHVPRLSLRPHEEIREGSHSRGKASGEGTGTCWP